MIRLENLSFGYGRSDEPVLRRLRLRFAAGELALVCGPTGSGKSTLLKTINGLCPHFAGGELTGEILIDGEPVTGLMPHELAHIVGFVNQQPDGSFVAETVAEEIAFGLEQLGMPPSEMHIRVEEIATALGIDHLLNSLLDELSGGEQQRVAIASALVAGQRVLVLDEPTSALDPAAAFEVLRLLKRLTRERGITVVLAEHRIERVLELVDSVTVLHGDGSASQGAPATVLSNYRLVPPIVELAQRLGWARAPLSVTEAQGLWAASEAKSRLHVGTVVETTTSNQKRILEVRGLSVHYGDFEALHAVHLDFARDQVTAIMGPNGSGKSSLLWAMLGIGHRSSGSVRIFDGSERQSEETAELTTEERLCLVTMVPQSAADLLFLPTVAEELAESDKFAAVAAGTTSGWFAQLAGRVDPGQHPRDLSAGQQLALVLAMQIAKGAGLLLLDEPTRGLDYQAKRELAKQIHLLKQIGRTVILASHDVEFVALVADRVVQLDHGRVRVDSPVAEALGAGSGMATQVAEVVGVPGILTVDKLLQLLEARA